MKSLKLKTKIGTLENEKFKIKNWNWNIDE